MTIDQIINDLKQKKYSPVYFLHGDESFYIDKISSYIEEHVLDENERAFNQHVIYGKDTDKLSLLSLARRFPMMAERQVVIVREAQEMKNLIAKSDDEDADKNKDQLLEYILKPAPTTILVICYKYKTFDKRTRLAKALQKHSFLFEYKKMYDDKLPDWITNYVHSKQYRINPSSAVLLGEYLGNDLSKISNELDKLMLNVKQGNEITASHIETFIGISKDYNVFELQNAIVRKDVLKANRIAKYFAANPKSSPFVVTLGTLYSFFSKILIYHTLKDRKRESIVSALGINGYFVSQYESAARNYSVEKTRTIISHLRHYDLQSKGIGSNAGEGELLRELVFRILH